MVWVVILMVAVWELSWLSTLLHATHIAIVFFASVGVIVVVVGVRPCVAMLKLWQSEMHARRVEKKRGQEITRTNENGIVAQKVQLLKLNP
jgi:membrane protein implicated in regulation of membrane protease activity